MVDKITFFVSYYEAAKLLPEDERGAFLMGLLSYAFEGSDPDFSGSQKLAFTLIKPNIDSSVRSHGAGKSGGRPKKGETTSKTPLKTPLETPLKTTRKTNKDMDRDMDKDRDMEMDALEIDPLDQSISNANASGDAAAADAAPPAAKKLACPECGGPMHFETDGAMFRCMDGTCGATVKPSELIAGSQPLAGRSSLAAELFCGSRKVPAYVCPVCGEKVTCEIDGRRCPAHGIVEAVIRDV